MINKPPELLKYGAISGIDSSAELTKRLIMPFAEPRYLLVFIPIALDKSYIIPRVLLDILLIFVHRYRIAERKIMLVLTAARL
jgi:hypothetical protein